VAENASTTRFSVLVTVHPKGIILIIIVGVITLVTVRLAVLILWLVPKRLSWVNAGRFGPGEDDHGVRLATRPKIGPAIPTRASPLTASTIREFCGRKLQSGSPYRGPQEGNQAD
jgi:hypothetical protein